MDFLEPRVRAVSAQAVFVAGVAGCLAACLPIDRTPIEATASFTAALAEADRVAIVQPGTLEAGAAKIDLTPPGAWPLAGYGSRLGRPSTGVHDRLFARALALRAGDRAIVLVALDLLAVTNDVVEAVEARVRRAVPLASGGLILAATHTHSGFGGVARRVWESFAAGEYDERLFRFLADRAAAVAVEAVGRLAPAEIAWGEAAAPERIANRMIPGGYTDPALPFLAVRRPDGTIVAVLVNFSAHATVLKADNFLLSGDYPGAVSRALEASGGVALFTAGAVADQTAVPPQAADRFAAMEAMGRELGGRVEAARRALPPAAWSGRAVVDAWRLALPLPPTQIKVSPGRRLPFAIGNALFDRRTTVSVAVVGDGVLLGVPCDLSAAIGAEWKATAGRLGRRAVVVGFANDYVGYVIPSESYETSHYEARMSFNGPYMDRYLSAVADRVFARLGPS